MNDLLEEIERQGTPYRIDGTRGTYYILSADELMDLLRAIPGDGEPVPLFTPQDFGLTEADLVAYEARRKLRRDHIELDALARLDVNLEQRLRRLSEIQSIRPLSEEEAREREELLHALEAAMLCNLRAVAASTH